MVFAKALMMRTAGLLLIAAGNASAQAAAVLQARQGSRDVPCSVARTDKAQRCKSESGDDDRTYVQRAAYGFRHCDVDGCRWVYRFGTASPRDYWEWDDQF